jgi:hypothetical protein
VVITTSGAIKAPRTRPVACSILRNASRHSRAHLLTFWSVGIPVIVRQTISPLPQLARMNCNQKLRYKDKLFREVCSEAVHAPSEHEIFCPGNLVPILSWLSLFIQNVVQSRGTRLPPDPPCALHFPKCHSRRTNTCDAPPLANVFQRSLDLDAGESQVLDRVSKECKESGYVPAAVFFEYGSFVRLRFSNNRSQRARMPN